MLVTFGICFKQQLDTRYLVFYNPSPPRMFCPWTFFENIGFNMVPSDPFMSHLATQLGYSAGSVRLCNWLSLRRLVSWINHLPPACWSTFWKSIFKHQSGCRFDILGSISYFIRILTYAIIYVLMHHIIFWLYLYFLNILYFFKYSCTNIFLRRSLCTFYSIIHNVVAIYFSYEVILISKCASNRYGFKNKNYRLE